MDFLFLILSAAHLHQVKQILLSFRLYLKILYKQLGVLSESLLHFVLHLLLLSVDAANEIHLLKLLQMQKLFLLGLPSVLFNCLSALRKVVVLLQLNLIQIPYVLMLVDLNLLRAELLAFLLKIRRLNKCVDFLRIFHVDWCSQLLFGILLVSFLRLQIVFFIKKLPAQIPYLSQVVFQRRDVFSTETFQWTSAFETGQPLFPVLRIACFLGANAQLQNSLNQIVFPHYLSRLVFLGFLKRILHLNY